MPRSEVRLDALTGLRFVAALWVVLYHFTPALLAGAPQPVRNVVGAGMLGVDLFFVLSGFVLAYTYLAPSREWNARAFWHARFARIYPGLAFSVLIAMLAGAASGSPRALDPISLIPVLGLLQAWGPEPQAWNGPAWSLSVEACFYLLFPFIGPRLCNLSRNALLLTMILAWLAGLAATWLAAPLQSNMWSNWLAWWPPFHLHEFLIGMCAGLLFRQGNLSKRGGAWLSVPAGLILLVLLTQITAMTVLVHNGLLGPLIALLILGLARGGGPLAWVLERRPLRVLGEASYALYILQAPVWFLWHAVWGGPTSTEMDWAIDLQPAWAVLTFLPFLFACCLLTYRWIERPARQAILSMGAPRANQ